MIRRPPRSTRTDTSFPTRRSSDVLGLPGRELFDFRRRVQYVFQDPYSALDPRMTVADIVGEPLVIHGVCDARSRAETVHELMPLVGLDARHLNRYPHSFSGGQQIGRAHV